MPGTVEKRIKSIAAKLPKEMSEEEQLEMAKSLDALANTLIDMYEEPRNRCHEKRSDLH